MPEVRTLKAIPRGLPLLELAEPNTVRLISTAHIMEPSMAPLADDDDALKFLAEIERKTSLRQDEDIPLPDGVRRAELLTEAHGYGWTYVNAAFCYTRPQGSRFNDAERGAWYAAWGEGAAKTALAEISFHLTRELENVGVFENVTDYRELLAGFIGPFADLRQSDEDDFLSPDPAIGHPAGQKLARELRDAAVNGVVYPSVRKPDGLCLAAFRTTLVQNIRQGATWRLSWSGKRAPAIELV